MVCFMGKDKNGNDIDIVLTPRKHMNKIVIRPTPNADSRTCNEFLTRDTCYEDNLEHIKDVQRAMNWIGSKIMHTGLVHDKTKVIYKDEYIDLVMHGVTDDDFLKSDWWNKHITEERHHLNSFCPVDVNLIDVIEFLVDMVMQSNGRKGYLDVNLCKLNDPFILERAYWNTVKLLNDNVVVGR